MEHLTKVIEAALFAADRPLTTDDLRSLLPRTNAKQVRAALEELGGRLDDGDHAVELVEIGGGYQVLTRKIYAELLERAKLVQRPRRLSRAALETLAIIAYRQPVSRLEVEDIRGVSSEGVVRMLLERDLVDVAGRGEGLGRPLLYGTTPNFLELLGLNAVEELPRAEELAVLLRPRGPVTLGDDDDDDMEEHRVDLGGVSPPEITAGTPSPTDGDSPAAETPGEPSVDEDGRRGAGWIDREEPVENGRGDGEAVELDGREDGEREPTTE